MRTIAVLNQKGGCGKTTTVVNLAGCLAADGAEVLVVDMDPQAHATLALGIDPDALEENLFDILVDPGCPEPLEPLLLEVSDRIDLAPSGIVLSALEQKLVAEQAEDRTERLAAALAGLEKSYDYVLIDCPPNVGLLTFNALRAAGEVLIPLETSFFAIQGVQKLLETIGLLSDRIAHDLSVRILPTLFDGRTRYARETLAEIRDLFQELCFDTVIRQNVKLREAARRGAPLISYARSANGALDYAALATEIAAEGVDVQLGEPAVAELGEPAAAVQARQVVVHFRNAEARDVRIAGDFNGWVPDKGVRSTTETTDGEQVWTKTLELAPGTYQYRYVVDGDWREDPSNPHQAPGRVGERNSVLVVR